MSVKKKVLLMRSLLYFQETIRNGKITLTAQKNGIKISNLSKMLKDLEEELHVQLLHRSRDGVRPTTAGKQIYNMTLRVEEKLRLFESILSRREDEIKVIRVYIDGEFEVDRLDDFLRENELCLVEAADSLETADLAVVRDKPADTGNKAVVKHTIGSTIKQDVYFIYDGANEEAVKLYKFLEASIM